MGDSCVPATSSDMISIRHLEGERLCVHMLLYSVTPEQAGWIVQGGSNGRQHRQFRIGRQCKAPGVFNQ